MSARRFGVVALAALIVVGGIYGALALLWTPDERRWVEQFEAFERIPRNDWLPLQDRVESESVLTGTIFPRWSDTMAQRFTVYEVPGGHVAEIAKDVAATLWRDEPTEVPVDRFGLTWRERPG